jgi:hypothetical protein
MIMDTNSATVAYLNGRQDAFLGYDASPESWGYETEEDMANYRQGYLAGESGYENEVNTGISAEE